MSTKKEWRRAIRRRLRAGTLDELPRWRAYRSRAFFDVLRDYCREKEQTAPREAMSFARALVGIAHSLEDPAREPASCIAHFTLASCLRAAGQLDEADREYAVARRYLSTVPAADRARYLRRLAALRGDQRRCGEAQRLLDRSLDENPSSFWHRVRVASTRAFVFGTNGRYEDAARVLLDLIEGDLRMTGRATRNRRLRIPKKQRAFLQAILCNLDLAFSSLENPPPDLERRAKKVLSLFRSSVVNWLDGSYLGAKSTWIAAIFDMKNGYYEDVIGTLLSIRFTIRSENPTEGLLMSIDLLTCYLATGRVDEAKSLGVEIDRMAAKQLPGTTASQAITRLRRVVAGVEIGDATQRAATARAAVVATTQRRCQSTARSFRVP